ncbi:MAG: HD domain-containing protein [Minisyncoccia bacterium]
MKKSASHEIESIGRFVYEMGAHQNTPRSGFWLLGSGHQSVAEHLFRTAYIAYALAYLTPEADKNKTVLMALTHDIAEGRTSDLNYAHQRYGRLGERNALADIANAVPFGKDFEALYLEEQERKTLEARLVKDADQLEWVASLRAEEVKGNTKANVWAKIAAKRIKTDAGKKVLKILLKMHPDAWWFDEADSWFVNRKEKDRRWKHSKK